MGLLRKAAVKFNPELDDMGKALRDRILRLPPAKNSPDTALSLLKAYGSFQAGLCLSLSGDQYISYASSGAGSNSVTVNRDSIDAQAGKGDFFRLDSPDMVSGFPAGKETRFWVFPLDNNKPRTNLLMVTEEGKTQFSPETLEAIIREAGGALIPPAVKETQAPQKGKGLFAAAGKEKTGQEIQEYRKTHPAFQAIVLELPENAGETGESFGEKVSRMAGAFGSVLSLPPGNSLVLIPANLDRELLAHRLSKSLNTRILCQFEADDPDKALSLLGPYC
jgi:hypothetical protein